jgi:hypothetical protein
MLRSLDSSDLPSLFAIMSMSVASYSRTTSSIFT